MNENEYDPSTINNLPNILTIIRIIFTPLLLIFVFLIGQFSIPGIMSDNNGDGNIKFRIISGIIFLIIAFTDKLDGYFARRWRQITNFGKIADPIADKILINGTMICLTILGALDFWIVLIVIFREIFITAMRIVVLKKRVMAASIWGKIKTISQTVAIVLYLFPLYLVSSIFYNIPQIVMLISTLITIASGIDYYIKIYQVARD